MKMMSTQEILIHKDLAITSKMILIKRINSCYGLGTSLDRTGKASVCYEAVYRLVADRVTIPGWKEGS